MPRDEMHRPLKPMTLRRRLWRRRPGPLLAAALGLTAAFVTGAIWLPRIPAPLAGQPVVIAAIPPEAEIVTSSTSSPEDDAMPDGTTENPEDVIDQNAIEIIGGEAADDVAPEQMTQEDLAPDDAAAPERSAAMMIIPPHRPLPKAPLDAVTEKTDQGPLPRIAKTGTRPFDAYSQVTPLSVTHSDLPKITLVLGGMGLNPGLTRKAIESLPGDVTLGFAPYGDDLQAQVNRARSAGHEILLQVPMEPVGYPGNSPGPRTLLADAKPEENLASLRWLMSRFAGYSGITNYMGGRLLTSEEALRPIMKDVKSRGLVYLEDGTLDMTLSTSVSQDVNLPVQRATMVIDAEPTAAAIAAALARLEREARQNGAVIATGSGLDVTIETVAEWAKTLQDKGILLVPVSTAYKGKAS